jgi:hypothetical protein
VTKKAYWILASLLVFVERNHRFPRIKEQVQFLKVGIGLSGVPELPQLSLIDLIDQKEVGQQMRVLRTNLKGIDQLRPNPSDIVRRRKT